MTAATANRVERSILYRYAYFDRARDIRETDSAEDDGTRNVRDDIALHTVCDRTAGRGRSSDVGAAAACTATGAGWWLQRGVANSGVMIQSAVDSGAGAHRRSPPSAATPLALRIPEASVLRTQGSPPPVTAASCRIGRGWHALPHAPRRATRRARLHAVCSGTLLRDDYYELPGSLGGEEAGGAAHELSAPRVQPLHPREPRSIVFIT